MITPADLSPADWAALAELRQRQTIRVDQAGPHAESLTRFTAAEAIGFDLCSTRVAVADRTAVQIALGFSERGATGFDGVMFADAPHWRWISDVDSAGAAPALLRNHEKRQPIGIDWDKFCSYVVRSYGQRNQDVTVAMVAKRFGHSIEDVIDWIDGRYWAFRTGAGPLGEQLVELEGE